MSVGANVDTAGTDALSGRMDLDAGIRLAEATFQSPRKALRLDRCPIQFACSGTLKDEPTGDYCPAARNQPKNRPHSEERHADPIG